MKLRRALAAAAATAALAPIALLSAPAAFATDDPTPTATDTTAPAVDETTAPAEDETTAPAEDETTAPAEDETTEPAEDETTAPGEDETTEPAEDETTEPAEDETTEPAPDETETADPEPSVCEDSKVDVSISGLPGKIAAGSGWHKFSLNVLNNSDSTLEDLDFFAGASSDAEGANLFQSKQVQLQGWNPDTNAWEDLNEGGYAVGYVGYTDELKPDYEVNVPLRVNVKSTAPVGAGFSLGATIYGDADGECTGFGEVSYKFQIVSSGTDTDGTKPQEGGQAPITDEKPSSDTPKVEGELAHTGSDSNLPVIGTVGGIAILAGTGVVFAMRRRRAGTEA